ncbi:MAG: NAD(P)/FAD-dependent oxidoreductase [Polaromonas sp.]|jgi:predicted NAD/FAD-binding protein
MTNKATPRIAIVGSGISGLATAHALQGQAAITLFEAADYFGGHTHTVDVTLAAPEGAVTHGVDTGFLVFNERTYPNLIKLLADLKVEVAKSDMSFSVQVPRADGQQLEWSGSSLSSVFAQRKNFVNVRFLRMLSDIMRFNKVTTALANANLEAAMMQPLGDFLKDQKLSDEFRDWYFLPMMGCIWSCPTDQMLQFPVATMIRFCYNHGLIQVTNRPQWWTVKGGARHYVEKIITPIADKRLNTPVKLIARDAAGVHVTTEAGTELFDKVVLATHSDQSLAMLQAPSEAEQSALGAIRYQANRAVLHTDTSVLPQNKIAWAAWNYERAQQTDRASSHQSTSVCLHYLLNMLQPLPFTQSVLVSLNPLKEIARQHIMAEFDYAHPVFDLAAVRAQGEIAALQGQQNTYFCGAWTGYGFHEDGLKSGLKVAEHILKPPGVAA